MDQDQFSIADLRQYINGGTRSLYAPPLDLTPSINNPYNNNNMLVFRSDSTTNIGGASSAGEGFGGFDNGGGGRWPRQETLTLLEIRSRLDHKFKEANQKGPLWDEVSRIMSEEHGYQRSGKKCREKFENLYKYYKKTKEGKAGRQDGKHYRFFRQLEALYGDTSNNSASASASETNLVGGNFYNNYPNKNTTSLANNDQDTSLSLSKFSDSHTTSSDDSDDNEGIYNKKRGKKCLKLKIKDFIDAQMRKLMDKQEAWMEKMMKTIEHKEQERMLREEEWRKQDAARIEMEHKFWASERAWIESRDASLMDTFQKLSGKVIRASPSEELMAPANEIRSLSENGSDQTMNNNLVKGEIWHDQSEEIARKMASFGHDRSGLMCKEKWESVNNYALKCHKKRKEDSKGCNFYQNHESICSQGGGAYCEASDQQGVDHTIRLNIDHGNSNSTSNAMSESCFRYFMGDDYGRIMDWKH